MSDDKTGAGAIRRAIDSLSAAELRRSSRIKWRLFEEDVLPAWVADMDFPVAPPVHRAVRDLVDRHDLGYHIVPLSPRLRDALVSRMAERFSWQIEPQRITPLVNLLQGLDVSVLLHSRPGDGVIVQTPIYPPFLAAVLSSGRRLVENPLVRGADRFEIDFDQLRASIDPSVRLLLLCNPHNPSGRVFEREELSALGELVLEHDLIVVADEIHADLTYPGHRHLPFATLGPELAQRTITLTSATKAFNLAGLPCAFAIFGSDRCQQPFLDLPPHALGHCGMLDDAATCAAWTEGQPWLDEVMAYLLENRRLLLDFFARELPALRVLSPEGTYLAWLDCRDLDLPGDPFEFFLEHARVALSRGPGFGTRGEGCARLNFATSQTILLEILERMAAASATTSTRLPR
jgi:cystathionine beta-lyase